MHHRPQVTLPLSPELSACLNGLGHFTYLPHPGNAGDALTSASTQLLFKQLGLSYSLCGEQHADNSASTLVYGGGGGLPPEKSDLPGLLHLFAQPKIKRCVILPQRMRNCPELLEALDERFTVFLRDRRSYDYAVSHNRRAQFHLAHDMAFCMNPTQFNATAHAGKIFPSYLNYRMARWRQIFRNQPDNESQGIIRRYLIRHTIRTRIASGLPSCTQRLANGKKTAWMLRSDRKRATGITPQAAASFDLSLIHDNFRMLIPDDFLVTHYFLKALSKADVIVSDRLHVAIGAALLGKQVVMLDNADGELGEVWEQSMKQLPHVHYCHSDWEFDSTLQHAIHLARSSAQHAPSPDTFCH